MIGTECKCRFWDANLPYRPVFPPSMNESLEIFASLIRSLAHSISSIKSWPSPPKWSLPRIRLASSPTDITIEHLARSLAFSLSLLGSFQMHSFAQSVHESHRFVHPRLHFPWLQFHNPYLGHLSRLDRWLEEWSALPRTTVGTLDLCVRLSCSIVAYWTHESRT